MASFVLCKACGAHLFASKLLEPCPSCKASRGRHKRLAAALGVSVMLSGGMACNRPSPAMDIYGGPPIEEFEEPLEEPTSQQDMGVDDASADHGSAKVNVVSEDPSIDVAAYGASATELDPPKLEVDDKE